MAEPPNIEQIVNDFVTVLQSRLGQTTPINGNREPQVKDFIYLVLMLADLLLLVFLGADAIGKLSKVESFQNTVQLFGQGAQFIITSVCVVGVSWFKNTFLRIEEKTWFRGLVIVGMLFLLLITILRHNELININVKIETNSSQEVYLLINKKMRELESGNYKFPVFLWGNKVVLRDPKASSERVINIGFFDLFDCNSWFGKKSFSVTPIGKMSWIMSQTNGLGSATVTLTKQTSFDSSFLADLEEMFEKSAIEIREKNTIEFTLSENKSIRKINMPYGEYNFKVKGKLSNSQDQKVEVSIVTSSTKYPYKEIENDTIGFYDPSITLEVKSKQNPQSTTK